MIIDCHMHYEPRIYPLDRMLAGMAQHGIEQTALIASMVDPFCLHGKAVKATGDLLRQSLLHANPAGQLIYRSTVKKSGHFFLLGKKYCIYDKPDNSTVVEAMRAHPDKFLGWIFVNPNADANPLEEIEKWASEPGMVGVKAHAFWHRYSISSLDPVAAWCSDNGYPLLIHLGAKEGGDFRRLPEKFPRLNVIYAHAGIPFYKSLWAYAKGRANVYVDLSSPYLNEHLLRMTVDYLGADKCLYGTDGPYGSQREGEDFDYGLIKGWVNGLSLSDSEREKVRCGNFQNLRKT
jgi:predicted TIM-barrel fold metal-dependent hydrolase